MTAKAQPIDPIMPPAAAHLKGQSMECIYNEENHSYTVDGKLVPSVTEICSRLTAGKYDDTNPAMVEQAKRRGTAVHELCELIDCGIDPEELGIPPELVGYVNAWLAFKRDYRPKWDYLEKIVFTSEYAGRADRIGEVDGKPCIVDIKTTGSMDRLSRLSLFFQLRAYINACGGCLRGMGVQLKKNGRYTVYRAEKIRDNDLDGRNLGLLWGGLLETAKLIGGYE